MVLIIRNYVYYWKPKGLSDEKINSIKTSDYGFTPNLGYYDTIKVRVKFNGGYLKQDRPTLLYEITNNFNVSSYPILEIWSC